MSFVDAQRDAVKLASGVATQAIKSPTSGKFQSRNEVRNRIGEIQREQSRTLSNRSFVSLSALESGRRVASVPKKGCLINIRMRPYKIISTYTLSLTLTHPFPGIATTRMCWVLGVGWVSLARWTRWRPCQTPSAGTRSTPVRWLCGVPPAATAP
jgi:hypothetical protein